MKTISLKEYAPIIVNPNEANEIFEKIMEANPLENEIQIDMEDIISLSSQSICIIFGGLYDSLGCDKFHENLLLLNCNDILGDYMSFILNERKNKLEEENEQRN